MLAGDVTTAVFVQETAKPQYYFTRWYSNSIPLEGGTAALK